MEKVVVTKPAIGLLYMQVCAEKNATDEEILSVCNKKNPCGTTTGWCHVIRQDEEFPHKNPVQCVDNPDRIHFLINC